MRDAVSGPMSWWLGRQGCGEGNAVSSWGEQWTGVQ